MPQFDFTTYSSQIFWFSICFAVLYATVSLIILPRIRQIIDERQAVVDADRSKASDLENQISNLSAKADLLRQEAGQKYQLSIEEATKAATANKDKALEELKNKIENLTKKSRQELREFVAKSQSQNDLAISNLTKLIKEKIFG